MTDGVNFSVGDIGALDRDDAVVLYRQGRMKYGGWTSRRLKPGLGTLESKILSKSKKNPKSIALAETDCNCLHHWLLHSVMDHDKGEFHDFCISFASYINVSILYYNLEKFNLMRIQTSKFHLSNSEMAQTENGSIKILFMITWITIRD